MKTPTILSFITAALVSISGLLAQTPKPVRTQSGLVQARWKTASRCTKAFRSPRLRWAICVGGAPQPPMAWTGVRSADKFAPACMQVPIVIAALGMEAVATSEDCLYLNVWTPAKSANEKLAVMVWIYGGGFTIGGTSLRLTTERISPRRACVVVSVSLSPGRVWLPGASAVTAEQERPFRQLRPAGSDRRIAVGEAQHRGVRR